MQDTLDGLFDCIYIISLAQSDDRRAVIRRHFADLQPGSGADFPFATLSETRRRLLAEYAQRYGYRLKAAPV